MMLIERGGNYIPHLIQEGEGQMLDFKFAITDSRKIARSLVAFANTDGGTLLIGVKDNGVIAGVRSDEEFYMVEAAAQLYSEPEIHFISKRWELGDKSVLEITIPKSDKRPHFAKEKDGRNLVYIRVKDQNLLANRVLLQVWKQQDRKSGIHIKYSIKEKILLEMLENNKQITLKQFMDLAQLSKFHAENLLINFVLLDIVEMVFTEKDVYYVLNPDKMLEI